MIFGLPSSTEVNRQLPKKAVIEKFDLKGRDRTAFDSLIHRIVITNEVSPRTVNVSEGEIKGIFILNVELHEESYDPNVISMLFKAIDQRMVMVLTCGPRCRPVVFHGRMVEGSWRLTDEMTFELEGIGMDDVWRNMVLGVGGFTLEDGNDLDSQIRIEGERDARRKEIDRLEKRMMSTKQDREKREIYARIRTLREGL